MLANGLKLILQDLKSIENALKILDDVGRCSGLSIGIGKTKFKQLGKPIISKIKGKITTVITLALSPLIYTSSLIDTTPPKNKTTEISQTTHKTAACLYK